MTSLGPISLAEAQSLGLAAKDYCARIQGIHAQDHHAQVAASEIERRLIELGFTEGAEVQIHHEGFFSPYPLAAQINGAMHPNSHAGFTR